jgi:antitoxin component of MazEF toxin-antitoxin module
MQMLKKLVKYGNSNALILDKAILELLEIGEGSVIKIKTDGKSIILTPHVKAEPQKVQETFTHEQATFEANLKERFKGYNGITPEEEERLGKEYYELMKELRRLTEDLSKNPEFLKRLNHMNKEMDTTSPEYAEAYKALRNKLSPELMRIEQEMIGFENKNKLSLKDTQEPIQSPDEKQQAALMQEFMIAHKKNRGIYEAYAELLNNPDYQHQAQLVVEKYGSDKQSANYLNAMEKLNNQYLPEYVQAQEELKAIAKRYSNN